MGMLKPTIHDNEKYNDEGDATYARAIAPLGGGFTRANFILWVKL